MPISQEEFDALEVGDTVLINASVTHISGTIFRLCSGRVVGRTATGMVKVETATGNAKTFMAPKKERGGKYDSAYLVTREEFEAAQAKAVKVSQANRLNVALQNVGKMSTRLNSGDEIFMAIADLEAKAKNYFG